MAKCPNCGARIQWDATECSHCPATFGPGSAWHPEPESPEEKRVVEAIHPPPPPEPMGRIALVNVSLSLAFLLSFVGLSPLGYLITQFGQLSLMQSLGAPNAGLLAFFANYWLVALVIYLLLRAVRAETVLESSIGALVCLGLANFILVAAVAARTLAASVPGGGASFVLGFYLPYAIIPARILLLVGLAWLVGASLAARRKVSRQPFTPWEFATLAAVLAAPAFFGWKLAFAPDGPLRIARETQALFESRCREAGEKIIKTPSEAVSSVYLEPDGGVHLERIKGGAYGGRSSSILGEPLVNSGWLLHFEKRNPYKSKGDTPAAPYLRHYKKDWKGQPVHELESRYGVIAKGLTSKEEEKTGLFGEEIRVVDLKTQETLATTTYFRNDKRHRFCGHAPSGSFSTSEFVRRALALKREFGP